MKLFKENKFYVIVDKAGELPSFVTFGSSGGFRKCDSLVEASKFKELSNAKGAASKMKDLTVYSIEVTEKCGLDTPEGSTYWETWAWKEVKE